MIVRHESEDKLAEVLGQSIVQNSKQACQKNGKALLILPGGKSPLKLMAQLSQADLPWDQIRICPTDERCVPVASPESVAGQINRVLGKGHTHYIWHDDYTMNDQHIDIINKNIKTLSFPTTVTVLGMGPDGHFASIFPGQIWDEKTEKAYRVTAPKPPPERVTLPVKLLLQTQRLILLSCGQEKIRICEEIMQGQHPDLPVARLMKLAGERLELHMTP